MRKNLFMLLTVIIIVLKTSLTLSAYEGETYNQITEYEYQIGSDSPFEYDVLVPYYNTNEVSSIHVYSQNTGIDQTFDTFANDGSAHGLGCNDTYDITTYDSQGNELSNESVTVTNLSTTSSQCNDGNSDNSDSENEICSCFFESPNWQEYVGQIENIANSIPEPPNWEQVANTFYDEVGPSLVNDFENMLGTAPPAPDIADIGEPAPPPQPESPDANLDDRDISDNEPSFESPDELDESSFNQDDLENEAKIIEFREDDSGGFDIEDPVDSLPERPDEEVPIPGETDPGEYGENKPEQADVEFPEEPQPNQNSGDPIPNDPPTPEEGNSEAPTPGEPGDAPTPGGSNGNFDGAEYYKNQPD